ncbi:MAG: hypothetical protein M1829_005748 [Trizodia sp. TS-e1964]|nr:MAG: hypothetical protein M1829_005748 [Trizodia sp. TS-e1964]
MEQTIEKEPKLCSLGEHNVQQALDADLLALCSTMDLIAAASKEAVIIYRFNGERVSSSSPNIKASRLGWKPNGKLLATAWGDNVVRLVRPESSKIVHEVHTNWPLSTKITCLGWESNSTAPVKKVEDPLLKATKAYAPEITLDLPRDLASIDVESYLPKLSVLASGDDAFTTRASLDSLFHQPKSKEYLLTDILIVGADDGSIHLSIYDCFNIGTFYPSRLQNVLHQYQPIKHCSALRCSTHGLLFKAQAEQMPALYFVPLELRFLSNSEGYLSLIASKSTQLQNILRYVDQVQQLLEAEWTSSQDLPKRFIANVDEALVAESDSSFMDATFQLVVTGYCLKPLKTWLVEELSERGHKRWEKAVTSGYENICRLIHQNMLPSLQRCSVIVSRLRGLSKFHAPNPNLGLSTSDLESILETTLESTILAQKALNAAAKELELFRAFAVWLRLEIDVQTNPATPEEDSHTAEVQIDHGKVLAYLKGPLSISAVPGFLNTKLSPQSLDATAEPDLQSKISSLDQRASAVFQKIAEAQRRNVHIGRPVPLDYGYADRCDMRFISEGAHTAYIAAKTGTSSVILTEVSLREPNGENKGNIEKSKTISLNFSAADVKDVKFVDDIALMVLLSAEKKFYLLSVPFRDFLEEGESVTLEDFSANSPYLRHLFPRPSAFVPARMAINGLKGRRAICVLAEGGKSYQVMDLDSFDEGKEEM